MPFASLTAELDTRHLAGLTRRRRVVQTRNGARLQLDDATLLDFSSNDYLGLMQHPALVAAAQRGADAWGVGAGAAHLVTGHTAAHEQFETRFAAWVEKPAALGFSSGYQANLAVVSTLLDRHDAVFADRLNHASLNDACVLARAAFHRYAHNDLAALERLLAQSTARRKLIAVDGVFSMDGDCAPLPGLLALAERYDAWLYVDDAHGFGVLGAGRGSAAGLSSPRLIYMATLGKAAGVAGAAVAAEEVVIDYLINFARPYVCTTASPPLLAEALCASLTLIETEAWRRERLAEHVHQLRTGLADTPYRLAASSTPIQPLLVADSQAALHLSAQLAGRGLLVAAIRPPTVPTPRLRIVLSAQHSRDDVAQLIGALRELAGAA
ncbi:8-amino-7-oxononanoate synthase [Chitiniphilus purpureus]|uniref:8-amino-7-oxononanoate synthase n=1 Tax=Chitiniphilus purpureus TaxID=2981137 RepID=A0ABY6DSZ5_9NEIS|nr:8-amino-7-oxononanoate synthase [Chitiniphilus sp. CD1]UXY15013.1 8-amino-7-oxononanoate synthase [Chitiniphilus sp. CD1]